MILKPIWDKRLKFAVQKTETFNYRGNSSKPFNRSYSIEIEKHSENTFEAHFSKSIFFQLKIFNEFDEVITNNAKVSNLTLFYQVDNNCAFEKLLNQDEIINALSNDGVLLSKFIDNNEEKEELECCIEQITGSEQKIEKYLLKDLIRIHDYYGTLIDTENYLNLYEESTPKKILKKLFSKSRFIVSGTNLLQHTIKDNLILIEQLQGSENITAGFKADWNEIEYEFVNESFAIKNYPNLTFNHEKYFYKKDDMTLICYEKNHIIDSPTMRKEITHKITQL